MLDISDVVSALYTPVDGRANPIDVTMSLAAGGAPAGRHYQGTHAGPSDQQE